MRTANIVKLTDEQRQQLQRWTRSSTVGVRLARRARIILLAVLILLLTGWLPVNAGLVGLGWLTMSVCVLWLVTVSYLAREYWGLCPRPASA